MGNATKTASSPAPDGRLLRSERSRDAIVQALFDLVGDGILQPTAEQVAEQAGVGIRTVFRHFSDMESLFVAMVARLQAEALPLLRADRREGSLEARARGLVRQRVPFFERVAPYKRSASLMRWHSDFLRAQHLALARALRVDLVQWFPELEEAPADLVEALDLVTSFEAWDRLRGEQRLGRSRALAAMERGVVLLARDLAR
jgi:AcrR family transcriptional regulator